MDYLELEQIAEQLLSREPNASAAGRAISDLDSTTVMVTGGGGSIGSQLCRQILEANPSKIVIFEISEFAGYKILNELQTGLKSKEIDCEVHLVLGSVQNSAQLMHCFDRFRPHVVFHTAAYKHVPIVEGNVIEGAANNIIGTINVANASIKYEVEKAILISTDKAVRPESVMGATKRVAELVFMLFGKKQSKTLFSMVRFGNVFGSSGSVVPLFLSQIKNDGPITITDKDVTRYFMTIKEAAQLVISASVLSKGGEIFVLDMGKPVKILEICEKLAKLAGKVIYFEGAGKAPENGLLITEIGLRPGEKLNEELFVSDTALRTKNKDIFIEIEQSVDFEELEFLVGDIVKSIREFNESKFIELLKAQIIGYSNKTVSN